jgi:hypothetical protein
MASPLISFERGATDNANIISSSSFGLIRTKFHRLLPLTHSLKHHQGLFRNFQLYHLYNIAGKQCQTACADLPVRALTSFTNLIKN